jgi:protein-ribulosamine 3-kinase
MFHTPEYLQDFFVAVLQMAEGAAPGPDLIGYRFLSGGCMNNTLVLSSSAGSFCLKYNEDPSPRYLEAEVRNLATLRKADSLPIPKTLAYGVHEGKEFLLLEYIEAGPRAADYWPALGQGLALLHFHTNPVFGGVPSNYIGSLPQTNKAEHSGAVFFANQRILVQAGLALYNELLPSSLFQQLERLAIRLPDLIPNELPALVHGDLWSGNLLVNQAGYPCLIDPSTHFGLREAELAFTSLFGGFDDSFLDSYNEVFPLEPGFADRRDLYNLYPLLTHINMFGSGYLPGVEKIIIQFS